MIGLSMIFVWLVGWFLFFLLLRRRWPVCALCGAVTVTWIALLVLYYFEYSVDPTLIAILMGGSLVGSGYYLAARLPDRWEVFKLPWLITGIAVIYWLLTEGRGWEPEALMVVLTVWLVTAAVEFGGRSSQTLRGAGRQLVECCRNW